MKVNHVTRILHTAVLWLAIVVASVGQELKPIEVIGPSSPIQKSSAVFIPVKNLTLDEFLAAEITVAPSEGAIAFHIATTPIIVFQGQESGKYTVTVGRNAKHAGWRKSLAEAATYAKAVSAPADFVSRLEKLHADAETLLPSRVGSCVVEVAGNVPFEPDPIDPPPPPSKVTQVTFIFEKDKSNVPRPVSLALRTLNEQGILATEFEEDSTVDGTPGGRVPSQYAIALKAAREVQQDSMPPVLVVQAGDTVVRVIKNPTTEQQVLDAAK